MMVRKYQEGDVQVITDFGSQLHHDYRFGLDTYSDCLICEEAGTLIGFVSYSIIYDRAEIVDVYVDERYRRRGCASKLLNAVINECKKARCNNVTLDVNQLNQPAIELYRSFGFKVVAKRAGYYNNGQDDAYVMDLELK